MHKRSYDKDVLGGIGVAARRHLSSKTPGSIVNEKGKFYATKEAEVAMRKLGLVVRELVRASDVIALPQTLLEREMFAKILVDQVLGNDMSLLVIAPACPDYGTGESFHSLIGSGISGEAQAALSGTLVLDKVFSRLGIKAEMQILIADTEIDHPEIIEKCAGGDVDFYQQQCSSVAEAVRNRVAISNIQVSTFTNVFGDTFHNAQHEYEALMRVRFQTNSSFRSEVERVSSERGLRHAQILGRDEKDGELAIRYMAQYLALGRIAREKSQPVIFLNYESPNRVYYNAGFYKGIEMGEIDRQVIPVLGTIIKK